MRTNVLSVFLTNNPPYCLAKTNFLNWEKKTKPFIRAKKKKNTRLFPGFHEYFSKWRKPKSYFLSQLAKRWTIGYIHDLTVTAEKPDLKVNNWENLLKIIWPRNIAHGLVDLHWIYTITCAKWNWLTLELLLHNRTKLEDQFAIENC